VRDAAAILKLRQAGWRVAVVWECATRANPGAAVDEVCQFVRKEKQYIEVSG
jgi:G:T-mismatch repair DNA endonuclease (very short patch repair protein)